VDDLACGVRAASGQVSSAVGEPDSASVSDLGFDTFLLMGRPEPGILQTFIEDVAPRVRDRVASARALVGAT
jgi:hypothetical protein